VSGSGNLYQVGTGSTTLTGSNSYTGTTNVSQGSLIAALSFSGGTINVTGGLAQVAQKGANVDPSGVSVVQGITITGGAMDLTNNAAVVEYTGASPISGLRTLLANGYVGGAWNGTAG